MTQTDNEIGDTIGTVSINVFTKERKIMTTEGWKDLPEGDVTIAYHSDAPKWFDAISSTEQGKLVTLEHTLNDIPQIIFAKSLTHPSGWFTWSSDADAVSVTDNTGIHVFNKLTVTKTTKSSVTVDVSKLGGKYCLYLFSKNGFKHMGVPT